MRINASFLLKADQISDYIPGLSTITNSIDLFQKYVVFPSKQKASISNSHYYTYLQQKSFSRCIVLLIPVIGNIIIGIYDLAKRKYNYKGTVLAATQPVAPSARQSSQKYSPPQPSSEGFASDKGRQLGKYAKSLVMGKKGARVSKAVQHDYSQATLMAGYDEETARQLATGMHEEQPQVSSSLEQWPSGESGSCEHSLIESFIDLFPHLPTKLDPIGPLAIVKGNQLEGAHSHQNIHSSLAVHYHGARPSRLSEAKLHEKLKDVLRLKCPGCISGCIKNLIAQGRRLLKEIKEEISLQGVFYLATAYELYRNLNMQEYKFDWPLLDEYLDKLENSLKEGESLLHYFAAHENRSIFIYLFVKRPNIKTYLTVSAENLAKETPLHVAVKGRFTSIVQLLLEYGADVKKLDSLHNNALHHACQSQKDCVDIVKLLLQYEPTLMEAKNEDGQTPLHLAAFTGNEKSFACLLNQTTGQLQLDQQDKKGNTPLHLAILGWSESSIKGKDPYCKIIEALVKKGADLNALNQENKTALALAFENAAITQALVQAKLSPQILASTLQSFYLSRKKISIFRIKAEQEWELEVSLEEIYVRLGMIEREEREARDQALGKHSDYLQDGRIQTYETIFEPKQNIELEKLFEHESLAKRGPKRIYLQGAAGSGKSTLCHYIAYRWAKGDLWQEIFSYVFCIPLRNFTKEKYPADKEYTPADLIAREYAGQIDPRVIEACIHNSALQEKTLLILDGYDELSADAQRNISLAKAFKELKKLFPHILITSRPGGCSFNRSCDLELLGFDKEGIGRYIDRFFKEVQAEEKKVKLYHLLNTSPQVLSLAHTPINLALLCCLFNEDPGFFDSNHSITMTAIYEQIVNWMYKWFLLRKIGLNQYKQTKEKILEKKNLRHNSEVAKIATAFEDLAFFAMEKDTLYLSREKIDEVSGAGITSDELTDCGLMRIPAAEEKGYFIHLTFQEFLTASKVANQYLKGERQACQNFVRQYKFEPRYGLVLRMIAGYLSLATSSDGGYSDSDALQSFFDDLFAEPHDLAARSELYLIAECFEECRDPTLVNQYADFIKLVKDYIKYLCLLNLDFGRLLRNRNFLNHPEILHTIRELLSDPKTKENTLRILLSISNTGLNLTLEIVGLIVEELKNSKTYPDARRYAAFILEKIARQGGELPQEALAALIQAFGETFSIVSVPATRALEAIAKQEGKLSEKVLAFLIQTFKEGDSRIKYSAASTLGEIARQRGKLSEKVLAFLIQTFEEGDSRIKSYAASTLGEIAKQGGELPKEALEALIQAFKKGDSKTKDSAVDVLTEIAEQRGELPKEALDALIQALKEGDSKTKHSAARVLRTIADQGGELPKETLGALIQALKEGDSKTKVCTANAIEAIADQGGELPKEALDALIQAFKEGDSKTKDSAADTLGAIARQGGELSKEALAALVQTLKEGNSMTKGYAADALGTIVKQGGELPKEALATLIQALQEGDRETRYSAADALGAIVKQGGEFSKEVLATFIQALKEGDSLAKVYVVSAIKEIVKQVGKLPKEGLNSLIQALKEGDSLTKVYIVNAIKEIAKQGGELPKEVLAVLIQVFKEGDRETEYSAINTLGAIVEQGSELPKEALAILIQALKEGDRETKCSAADALGAIARQGGEFSKEALAALIQALKEGDRETEYSAANVLGAITRQGGEFSKEALAALIQALQEGDGETKYSAATALGATTGQGGELPKEVLVALIQAFNEGDREIKRSVADTLGAIAEQGGELPKEALAALIQVLKEGDIETTFSVANALRIIAKQGGEFSKEALASLIQALKEGDSMTKVYVANVIKARAKQGGEFSKEALEALIQVFKEGDGKTRRYAASALKKIAKQRGELPREVLAALLQALKEDVELTRFYAATVLKKFDKNALLKMSSQAFALITEVCFFIDYGFSIKGQQLQISDKRATYFCKDKLTLSYKEIREKLPKELAEWRRRLDSLSQIGSSQEPTDRI
ncbi:HEAT repeat domain-containing protein [Parachlamydia sp. AcF125]|uniref:HEAT repeat domain-containing protein n=1 Tax=Parachlamydia sp. AcF125 TaxID=2795736 RepID=UPI001BC95E89|nr:HEAT repeat domain-containing protein [Parachlamydia sp. AcF125]MBS4168373.1 hypothetical protein [Parachlamydia sp. AcF125]